MKQPLENKVANRNPEWIRWFSETNRSHLSVVGGKNASLGELISNLGASGIRVPDGFATTAAAFREFLGANDLTGPISQKLALLKKDGSNLPGIGAAVRKMILGAEFPPAMAGSILRARHDMEKRCGHRVESVAVRSSATAEDLPEASFAGQQQSFLNIRGDAALLDACRKCYASLFTDRAIIYRRNQGYDQMKVALSIGVQEMIRSDKAGSGVMFSIDTETGFPGCVLIDCAWGLGETVVQGMVEPDEYRIFKPLLGNPALTPIVEKTLGAKAKKMVYAKGGGPASRASTGSRQASTILVNTTAQERSRFVLSDEEVLQLARWACTIEKHYAQPMEPSTSCRRDPRRSNPGWGRPRCEPTGSSPPENHPRENPQGKELGSQSGLQADWPSATPSRRARSAASRALPRSDASWRDPCWSRESPIPTGCRS